MRFDTELGGEAIAVLQCFDDRLGQPLGRAVGLSIALPYRDP